MTVVRLWNGNLWVHSPIAPVDTLCAELRRIGEPTYVVAPNKTHHLFFLPFMQAFPKAQGYVADGLANKRPELTGYPTIPIEGPWAGELDSWFIEGLPALNETVWFHEESGTLVLTDLLFCFGADNPLVTRFVARLLGVYDKVGMSRTMKLATKDKRRLCRCIEPLLNLPICRVILAHDQIIEHEAGSKIREAFRWLN